MLHFNILHYQFLWIFHDKIQSNMHNFTLFSREIEWNLKCFHFFREMKSETNIPFTLFEKWKVKWFFVSLFSRSESEIEIPRDRDREVKFQKKSREFSRNETLAGYWWAWPLNDNTELYILVSGQFGTLSKLLLVVG